MGTFLVGSADGISGRNHAPVCNVRQPTISMWSQDCRGCELKPSGSRRVIWPQENVVILPVYQVCQMFIGIFDQFGDQISPSCS